MVGLVLGLGCGPFVSNSFFCCWTVGFGNAEGVRVVEGFPA